MDTYCSGCGCLLHDTSLLNREVKSNPFPTIMVVSTPDNNEKLSAKYY